MDSDNQTTARAFEINKRVVEAWLVREGLSDKLVPDLSDVSLDECIQASEIVRCTPAQANGDGIAKIVCFVEPTRIPQLYAWAIATTSLARVCQEHANGQ